MPYEQMNTIAERHVRLLELIRTSALSCRGLAERLEVSEQTVYRDIDFLRNSGHEITAGRSDRGWAYCVRHRSEPGASAE